MNSISQEPNNIRSRPGRAHRIWMDAQYGSYTQICSGPVLPTKINLNFLLEKGVVGIPKLFVTGLKIAGKGTQLLPSGWGLKEGGGATF